MLIFVFCFEHVFFVLIQHVCAHVFGSVVTQCFHSCSLASRPLGGVRWLLCAISWVMICFERVCVFSVLLQHVCAHVV